MRKLLEEYHFLGLEIETFNDMLDDWIVKNYAHLKSVSGYRDMLIEHIENVKQKRNDIANLINRLEDPLLKEILFMRYIDRKSNKEIAGKVGYSVNHLSRKFREGIKELEKLEG